MGDQVRKLLGAASAFAATAVAQQVLTQGWKAVMATEPPKNPEDPDNEWFEAVLWAAASAAVITAVRHYAKTKAHHYYERSVAAVED